MSREDSQLVNFTEISNGDDFEIFARDFLKGLGFQIQVHPGRGTDGGRDLIVVETLHGVHETTSTITWLVSCKHFAHSEKSVRNDDETRIEGRVNQHRADGFMGFYSTMPSTGLLDEFNGLSECPRNPKKVRHFDKGLIANALLTKPNLAVVFNQWLPKSYQRFVNSGGYKDRNRQSTPPPQASTQQIYPASKCWRLIIQIFESNRQDLFFAYHSLISPKGQLVSLEFAANDSGFCLKDLASNIVDLHTQTKYFVAEKLEDEGSPFLVLLCLPAMLIEADGAFNLLRLINDECENSTFPLDPLPIILTCANRQVPKGRHWEQAGYKAKKLSRSIVNSFADRKPLQDLRWLWVLDEEPPVKPEKTLPICLAQNIEGEAKTKKGGANSKRAVSELQDREALLISWTTDPCKKRSQQQFKARMQRVLFEGIPLFLIDRPGLFPNGKAALNPENMTADHPLDIFLRWSDEDFIANYVNLHEPLPPNREQKEACLRDYLRHSVIFWDDHRFQVPLKPPDVPGMTQSIGMLESHHVIPD